MLRILFLLGVLLINSPLASQNYTSVDHKVKNYPDFSGIEHLSIRIQNDFKSDGDRVRAAFIWLTHNIQYKQTIEDIFAAKPTLLYYSESGKKYQVNRYHMELIGKAFAKKEGVCYDYSLMLDYLCRDFGIPSKVILGITKTEIKDFEGKRLVKNHSWNAVQLGENWKLMDPTWAAGHSSLGSNGFVKNYSEHFYFTPPEEFVKHHFPSELYWQLVEEPITLDVFFSAPIFFPDYFEGHLKVESDTKGTVVISDKNRSFLEFSSVATKQDVYYFVSGERQMRRMRFRKKNRGYISKIKFRKGMREKAFLTIFVENKAVLNFKVEQASGKKVW